jgi:hypothetical protein
VAPLSRAAEPDAAFHKVRGGVRLNCNSNDQRTRKTASSIRPCERTLPAGGDAPGHRRTARHVEDYHRFEAAGPRWNGFVAGMDLVAVRTKPQRQIDR